MQKLSRARLLLRRDFKATDAERKAARRIVNAVKIELGERGAVWWTDGSPDYNRHMAINTPYVEWFKGLSNSERR